MASKMNPSDYKKLQNISAFLKGQEFYDLQACHSKNTKIVLGLPMKLLNLI